MPLCHYVDLQLLFSCSKVPGLPSVDVDKELTLIVIECYPADERYAYMHALELNYTGFKLVHACDATFLR